jgi:hypothetical protein
MTARDNLLLATCLFAHVFMNSIVWPNGQVHAAAPASKPAAPASPTHNRGVTRRLELWATPADRPGLTARYQLSRSSSLLYEPLRVAGNLTLTAPDQLELRDDEIGGATTRLSGETLTIVANDPSLPAAPSPSTTSSPPAAPSPGGPGRRWLRERLFALLRAQDPAALLADTIISVPRGPGMQLELAPARNHPARREVQRLRVRLDPDTGEVLEIQLTEAGGDLVTLTLSGHQRPN